MRNVFRHGEPSADSRGSPGPAQTSPSFADVLFVGFHPTWNLVKFLALGLGCLIALLAPSYRRGRIRERYAEWGRLLL